ncbi:MAG: lysyl-tRNA synthetase, class [Actinomycetota bacterium]|nr:lysyl-tRNA synthetase, class [Actinomycetota bacterium]
MAGVTPKPRRRRLPPEFAPRWAARAVGLVGLVSVVSALSPAMSGRMRLVVQVLPAFAPGAARVATVVTGTALLMLSSGLRRRKRRAWLLAVILAATVAVLHVVKGLDVEEASLSVATLLFLVATRGSFAGRSDPRSWAHPLAVLAGSSALAVAIGLAVVLADPDDPGGRPSVGAALPEVLRGLVGLGGPVPFGARALESQVAVTLVLLGGLVLCGTIASALRSPGGPHGLDDGDGARVRGLLERYGDQDSLGYFALRSDKSVMFSASAKAAVAYRVVGGVSLASGDPLGDPEAWPSAIGAWLAEAERYAWVPAVLAASERGADAFHRAGLDALELGDEAVIELERFSLEGRTMRPVRQAVNRVVRAGVRCDVVPVSALNRRDLQELVDAATRWRDGATERGFSMALGRFGDPSDDGCYVVRARDASGALCAALHLVPWGRQGLSLDLMRRSPECDNGVVELMVTELVGAARDLAMQRVSLNFAVFRSVFERGGRLGAGPVLRLWRRLLLHASRFWQIESLYRANAKYQPIWSPRYLCFRSARELPPVTLAALRAEAFLVLPRFGRRRTVRATSAQPAHASHGGPAFPR